ncbi:MAG TPA: Zn-dependent exopeptidase M28, partial [Candidatus Thermoplasmatota archaeon]|nr:Zn-dependent exopeptidase M28 [Candidatus Thermoplasmatota archaeon]
ATDYNFTTTDPDNDQVYYFVDWGDGSNSSWIGPHQSGDSLIQSHSWLKKGTYLIRSKAKDSHWDESNWSTLQVSMPLSYEPPHLRFFVWLLERFPNMFPIIRYLMRY